MGLAGAVFTDDYIDLLGKINIQTAEGRKVFQLETIDHFFYPFPIVL